MPGCFAVLLTGLALLGASPPPGEPEPITGDRARDVLVGTSKNSGAAEIE